jgi:hypothetical protein
MFCTRASYVHVPAHVFAPARPPRTAQATSSAGLTAVQRYSVSVVLVNRPPVLSPTRYEVLDTVATAGYTFTPPLSALTRSGAAVEYALPPSFQSQFAVDSSAGVLSIIGPALTQR